MSPELHSSSVTSQEVDGRTAWVRGLQEVTFPGLVAYLVDNPWLPDRVVFSEDPVTALVEKRRFFQAAMEQFDASEVAAKLFRSFSHGRIHINGLYQLAGLVNEYASESLTDEGAEEAVGDLPQAQKPHIAAKDLPLEGASQEVTLRSTDSMSETFQRVLEALAARAGVVVPAANLAEALGDMVDNSSEIEGRRASRAVRDLAGLVLDTLDLRQQYQPPDVLTVSHRQLRHAQRNEAIAPDALRDAKVVDNLERLQRIHFKLLVPDLKRPAGEYFSLDAKIAPDFAAQFLRAVFSKAQNNEEIWAQIDGLSDYQVCELALFANCAYRLMPHHPQYGYEKIISTQSSILAYLEGKPDAVIGGVGQDADTSFVRRGRRLALQRLQAIQPILQETLDMVRHNPDFRLIPPSKGRLSFAPAAFLRLKVIDGLKGSPDHLIVTPYGQRGAGAQTSLLEAFRAEREARAEAKVHTEVEVAQRHLKGESEGEIADALLMSATEVRSVLEYFTAFLYAANLTDEVDTPSAQEITGSDDKPQEDASLAQRAVEDFARDRTFTPEAEQELYRRIEAGRFAAYLLTTDQRPRSATDEELRTLRREGTRAEEIFFKANEPLINIALEGLPLEGSLEEAREEAKAALGIALVTFDYKSGYKFSTYARRTIRNNVITFLRRHSRQVRIPGRELGRINDLSTVESSLAQQFNRPATQKEIAAAMGLSLKELGEVYRAKATERLSSLDGDADDSVATAKQIEDPQALDPLAVVVAQDVRTRLMGYVDELGEPHSQIIRRRFLEGETRVSIAKDLGVTPQAVEQMEGRVLKRLRRLVQGG